jgi:hypothetical protein
MCKTEENPKNHMTLTYDLHLTLTLTLTFDLDFLDNKMFLEKNNFF